MSILPRKADIHGAVQKVWKVPKRTFRHPRGDNQGILAPPEVLFQRLRNV